MPLDPARPILRTEGLTKRFGQRVVVDDLNLSIHRGEIFGYIGPNGAGKTTTFRLLSGLLQPTSGRALVAEMDITRDRDLVKQLVGYLPDNFGIYPNLTVRQYLDFFAAAYKIPRTQRSERVETCLRFALALDSGDQRMGSLSRGIKQRVGIAKTLLHDPQVFILDEPLAVIDPLARVQMRQLLRDLADLGKAVFVSSHILPELADVCDTIGILNNGKLIAGGPVREILRAVRQKRLIEIHVLKFPQQARQVLAAAPGQWTPLAPSNVPGQGNVLQFEVEADETQLAQSLLLLLKRGIPVVSFSEVPADLEDLFVHLTR